MAAASSPFAPPNCSNNIFPKRGSGVPTFTVYMSFLMWWYIAAPIKRIHGRPVPRPLTLSFSKGESYRAERVESLDIRRSTVVSEEYQETLPFLPDSFHLLK